MTDEAFERARQEERDSPGQLTTAARLTNLEAHRAVQYDDTHRADRRLMAGLIVQVGLLVEAVETVLLEMRATR